MVAWNIQRFYCFSPGSNWQEEFSSQLSSTEIFQWSAANMWQAETGGSSVAEILSAAYTQQEIEIKGCLYFTFIRNVWRPSGDNISSRVAGAAERTRAAQSVSLSNCFDNRRTYETSASGTLIFFIKDTNVARHKEDNMNTNGLWRLSEERNETGNS